MSEDLLLSQRQYLPSRSLCMLFILLVNSFLLVNISFCFTGAFNSFFRGNSIQVTVVLNDWPKASPITLAKIRVTYTGNHLETDESRIMKELEAKTKRFLLNSSETEGREQLKSFLRGGSNDWASGLVTFEDSTNLSETTPSYIQMLPFLFFLLFVEIVTIKTVTLFHYKCTYSIFQIIRNAVLFWILFGASMHFAEILAERASLALEIKYNSAYSIFLGIVAVVSINLRLFYLRLNVSSDSIFEMKPLNQILEYSISLATILSPFISSFFFGYIRGLV